MTGAMLILSSVFASRTKSRKASWAASGTDTGVRSPARSKPTRRDKQCTFYRSLPAAVPEHKADVRFVLNCTPICVLVAVTVGARATKTAMPG